MVNSMQDFIDDIQAVMQEHYGSDLNYVIGEHIWWKEDEDVDGYRNATITLTVNLDSKKHHDIPNPHEINSVGQYCDSTMTWRESCGCSEANVLDNRHRYICIYLRKKEGS